MAMHSTFSCRSCGCSFEAIWGPEDEGYDMKHYYPYQCNSCNGVFVVLRRHNPKEKRLKFNAIAFYNEKEKKGYGYDIRKIICPYCEKYNVSRIFPNEMMLNSNSGEGLTVLSCPKCGNKLQHKICFIT